MKKIFENKKRIALTTLAAILIAVIAISGTLAYFTDKDEVVNTFTMGKVDISLDEPNWNDDDGSELLPGNVREKDPTVTAIEGTSYMRIRMELVDGEGNLITDQDRIDLILETLYYDKEDVIDLSKRYKTSELTALETSGDIQFEYNKDLFEFAGIETGKPGARYYNYKTVLEQDDVAVLFTHVIIPRDWHNEQIFTLGGDEYETTSNGSIEVITKGTGYKIIIKAEAIQAEEIDSAEDAFELLNESTGVTIDDSVI